MYDFIQQVSWPHVTIFVALIYVVWIVTGIGKSRGVLMEGDARKINHFMVLVGAVFWFQTSSPDVDRASCRLACGILFLTLLLVCRFPNAALCRWAFLGYARESDRPHAAFHVWFSWLVSLMGLQLVDLIFGSIETTRVAAMILGIGDAVGEPIGRRFGRHRYRVRGILSHGATRSWEGSFAVALCTTAIMIGFWQLHWGTAWPALIFIATMTGLLIAIIEAWTPHGLDNFTIPLGAACIVRGLAEFSAAGSTLFANISIHH